MHALICKLFSLIVVVHILFFVHILLCICTCSIFEEPITLSMRRVNNINATYICMLYEMKKTTFENLFYFYWMPAWMKNNEWGKAGHGAKKCICQNLSLFTSQNKTWHNCTTSVGQNLVNSVIPPYIVRVYVSADLIQIFASLFSIPTLDCYFYLL
jgi:hypothetical protein